MEPSDSSCNVSKNGTRKRRTVNVSLDLRSEGECHEVGGKTPQNGRNQLQRVITRKSLEN